MSKKKINVQGRERNLFKTKAMKKLSGVLATLLVISMLTPILAFAATWDWSYSRNGQVNGTVALDVHHGDTVTVHVYDNRVGGGFEVTTATYNGDANGKYVYTINHRLENAYSSVYLRVYENGAWSDKTTPKDRPRAGGGGGGGWGPIFPGSDIVGSDGRANADRLAALLKDNANATLEFSGDFVLLPASALQEGNSLKLINEVGSYTLPLRAINYAGLGDQLNLELADLWIRVEIKEVSDQVQAAIEAAAAKLGSEVKATAVDFYVGGENYAGDDQVAIKGFGNTYANRTISVEGSVDNKKATGVVFNPNTNVLSFVPSTFAADGNDTEATIKRNTNSIYTVIESDISFNDVSTHWGRQYIDLLANKLIVDGYEDGSFGPERNVTRAEFAALITRSLGLDTSVTSSTYFTDVTSGSWYAGVVNAAASAGLVDGYEDGTFRPNDQINREELAAMVVRASAYSGNEISVSASEQASLLARFADSTEIVWGHAEVAAAIKSGIVDGMTDTTVVPRADATRAQSAAMLNRFLDNANFIN